MRLPAIISNFIGKNMAKWIGPSFIKRHVTTLFVYIGALLARPELQIPQEEAGKFVESGSSILYYLGIYLVAFLTDTFFASIPKKEEKKD